MSKKATLFSTGLYVLCALIWMTNFFIHWRQDGMLEISTVLFGIAGVSFALAAVLGMIRLHSLHKKTGEE